MICARLSLEGLTKSTGSPFRSRPRASNRLLRYVAAVLSLSLSISCCFSFTHSRTHAFRAVGSRFNMEVYQYQYWLANRLLHLD